MTRVFKKHERYWAGIAIFGDYRPWGVHKENGGTRADYPTHSGKILDLKSGRADAATHFAGMIDPELQDGVVIVTVPGHDPAKPGAGLRKVAAELVKPGNRRVNGSECLVRST